MKNIFTVVVIGLMATFILSGCGTSGGNSGIMMTYKIIPEPEWIRNGEPIEFENELWYPRDSVDILLDPEVIPVGEYRGIPVYIQAVDVRPYSRIYSKFGKAKFRSFETKSQNDQSKRAF